MTIHGVLLAAVDHYRLHAWVHAPLLNIDVISCDTPKVAIHLCYIDEVGLLNIH